MIVMDTDRDIYWMYFCLGLSCQIDWQRGLCFVGHSTQHSLWWPLVTCLCSTPAPLLNVSLKGNYVHLCITLLYKCWVSKSCTVLFRTVYPINIKYLCSFPMVDFFHHHVIFNLLLHFPGPIQEQLDIHIWLHRDHHTSLPYRVCTFLLHSKSPFYGKLAV